MPTRLVFIGSSTEQRDLADVIAQELSKAGLTPRRWWNEFSPGSVTIERLRELSSEVDGAVFIAGKDDKTWYRGQTLDTPRDNVVLEFGLFLSKLGLQSCILVSDQVKQPTDLAGISYVQLSHDHHTTASQVVGHMRRVLFADDYVPILAPARISADQVTLGLLMAATRPDHWHNRDLYVGSEAAKNWLSVCQERAYSPARFTQALKRQLLAAVRKTQGVRCVVSLGPGDASLDMDLVTELRIRESRLQYIPVDMCDGLLFGAMNKLGKATDVPTGILSDFEDETRFVLGQVQSFGLPPYLFTILGNTLGDLDHSEGVFLGLIRNALTSRDYLLLDVSVMLKGWEWQKDRRTSHLSYGPQYRRFIAHGIASRTHESIDSIVEDFDKRVEFKQTDDVDPEGVVINIVDAKQNRRLVCTITRYRHETMCEWLEQHGFRIVMSEVVPLDEVHGSGVFLVQRSAVS